MMSGLIRDFGLALRNLSRNANRTLVAVGTVACGVIAFLLAGGFIEWSLMYGREETIHSQLGHAQIVRPGYFERGIADPYSFLLPDEAAGKLGSMESVVSMTPRLVFSGLVSLGDTTVPFSGEGIDPERERPISNRITIRQGGDLADDKENKALLGEGLAKSLGAKPGTTLVLLTTAANGSPNAIEVSVAGIFSSVTKEYDDYAIRLPITLARKLMRVAGATSWVTVLDKTESAPAYVQALRARLPAQEFEIKSWRDLADFYNKTEALFTKQVNVMKVIIGLIIVLTITNTLTMSVMERTTEIGTSLAVGIRSTRVMRQFVLEGMLIGILGGLLGIAIGALLATLISGIGIPMPPPPGMAYGYVAEIMVSPQLSLDAFILAFVTTLAASAFPAWKAGRMIIVDALRYSQ